jgi:CRP-like cAMP-binding protein
MRRERRALPPSPLRLQLFPIRRRAARDRRCSVADIDAARLSAIPVFADLEPSELEAVAAKASELESPGGHVVATQGEFGHALYAIESGTADVLVDGEVVRSLGLRLIAFLKRDVWAPERLAPAAAARLQDVLDLHRSPG